MIKTAFLKYYLHSKKFPCFNCSLKMFSQLAKLCNHYHNPILWRLHHPQRGPWCSISTPFLPVYFLPVGISYKWTDMICGLLHLASLTQQNVVEVHPCYSWSQYIIIVNCCIVFPYRNILLFIYPFTRSWVPGLFSVSYCYCDILQQKKLNAESCCHPHLTAEVSC